MSHHTEETARKIEVRNSKKIEDWVFLQDYKQPVRINKTFLWFRQMRNIWREEKNTHFQLLQGMTKISRRPFQRLISTVVSRFSNTSESRGVCKENNVCKRFVAIAKNTESCWRDHVWDESATMLRRRSIPWETQVLRDREEKLKKSCENPKGMFDFWAGVRSTLSAYLAPVLAANEITRVSTVLFFFSKLGRDRDVEGVVGTNPFDAAECE